MRQEFVYLTELGRMPNESLSDDESIDKLINLYDELLENITLPLSYEEALVLVRIFPESAFYDLQWTLLRLVESMVKYENEINYLHLIDIRTGRKQTVKRNEKLKRRGIFLNLQTSEKNVL